MVSGILLMLFPQFSLINFGVTGELDMAADVMRWFGSVVIILGWIGLFSPVSVGNIQGLLLGDIAYLIVFFKFIENHGKYTVIAQVSCVYLVLYLMAVRIIYLVIQKSKKDKRE